MIIVPAPGTQGCGLARQGQGKQHPAHLPFLPAGQREGFGLTPGAGISAVEPQPFSPP